MDRRRTQPPKSVQVFLSPVSHVLRKAVARIAFIELSHQIIPKDFGDDGGRRDRCIARIAGNDRRLWHRDAGDPPRIDQEMPRITRGGELHYRAAHRFECGMIDVEPIDLRRVDHTDPKTDADLAHGCREAPALGAFVLLPLLGVVLQGTSSITYGAVADLVLDFFA